MQQHPYFYALARLHARAALRRQGYGLGEINHIIAGAADDVIDVATAQAELPPPVAPSGGIIAAIIAFFQSDVGQSLIALLLKLLLAA